MSRGIPEVEARRLVVRGFFADVINAIGVIFVALTVIAASLYVVARQREQARAAG